MVFVLSCLAMYGLMWASAGVVASTTIKEETNGYRLDLATRDYPE